HTIFSRDWSSDVCSSDLLMSLIANDLVVLITQNDFIQNNYVLIVFALTSLFLLLGLQKAHFGPPVRDVNLRFQNLPSEFEGYKRSEERRVGKESKIKC